MLTHALFRKPRSPLHFLSLSPSLIKSLCPACAASLMTSFPLPFPFPIADWKSGSRRFQLGTISVTISLLLCQLPISSTLIFSPHSCFVVFPVNAKMDNNTSNAFSFVLKWKSLADSVTEFLFHAFLLLLLCVPYTQRGLQIPVWSQVFPSPNSILFALPRKFFSSMMSTFSKL